MDGLSAVFNPGANEMIDELASEKILPAPAPVAGDPPADDEGEAMIPPLAPGLAWAVFPEPVRIRRPEDLDEAEGDESGNDEGADADASAPPSETSR